MAFTVNVNSFEHSVYSLCHYAPLIDPRHTCFVPNSTTRTSATVMYNTTNGQAHNNSTTNLSHRNARAQHLDILRCWVEMWQIFVRCWWICWTTNCRIVVSSSVGGVVQYVCSRCPRLSLAFCLIESVVYVWVCVCKGHSISWLVTSTNCDVKIMETKLEELTGTNLIFSNNEFFIFQSSCKVVFFGATGGLRIYFPWRPLSMLAAIQSRCCTAISTQRNDANQQLVTE